MIELYELSQLAAFVKTGTLSEAAAILHLSQPALSRNMKKLEQDLGVSIFLRRKNKLALNDNGQFLWEMAEKLLAEAESLAPRVQEFARRRRTIMLGVCSPAPIWRIAPLVADVYPHMSLQTEIEEESKLLKGLENELYQLVALHRKPEQPHFYFQECGGEKLLFSLPKTHKYARRKSLTFADMNGETMLLMANIGFWDFVRQEKMPDSKFLMQSDQATFNELVKSSSLPAFTTDLFENTRSLAPRRAKVTISDQEAQVVYYLVCLQENLPKYKDLFSLL